MKGVVCDVLYRMRLLRLTGHIVVPAPWARFLSSPELGLVLIPDVVGFQRGGPRRHMAATYGYWIRAEHKYLIELVCDTGLPPPMRRMFVRLIRSPTGGEVVTAAHALLHLDALGGCLDTLRAGCRERGLPTD
jgi:hypothetical protein